MSRRMPEARSRPLHGFTIVELLVVVAIIGVLLGMLLPAVQAAREAARRTRCGNNLRQVGLGLHTFHGARRRFPAGASVKGGLVHASAFSALLPFLEQAALMSLYDVERPWDQQAAEVAAAPIPLFDCPSTREANPMTDRLLEAIVPIHVFGTTDYAFCKGATDGWCVRTDGGGIVAAGSMPAALRGAFDIHFGASFHEITDGISSTFAMGEASGDPRWHVCHGRGCREPEADATGDLATAWSGWIIPEPNSTPYLAAGILASSMFGCTVEPINKYPVTDTFIDVARYLDDDCRGSEVGGGSSTSNFRSNHPDVCGFLYADGAVAFLGAAIDSQAYRALSTIQAGDATRP